MSDFEEVIPQDWENSSEHSVVNTQPRKPPVFLTETRGKKVQYDVVVPCGENYYRAVRWLYPANFRFNTWSQRKETNIRGTWQPIEDSDHMLVRSQLAIQFKHPAIRTISLKATQDAVDQWCFSNVHDPVVDYFTSLYKEWDGTPRLDTWLCSAFDVPETNYYKAVGSNWIKGLVRRALHPGCKFDYVLVLEGAQGIGKSTDLSVLGGEWHTEITLTPDSKDFFMALQGHLIVEFSEGETLSRSEVKQLKSIISSTKDTFRAPYAREAKDIPRRCVFAMTTNQSEYLKDETGNRRWLPVACTTVDIEWLKENRDQLFAEALARLEDNEESVHEFPLEETLAMQNSRVLEDPDTEKVTEWYFQRIDAQVREAGISTEQAFQGIQPVQGLSYNKMSRQDQMRIGSILRNNLFLERKRVYADGIMVNRYFPTNATNALQPTQLPTDVTEFMEF